MTPALYSSQYHFRMNTQHHCWNHYTPFNTNNTASSDSEIFFPFPFFNHLQNLISNTELLSLIAKKWLRNHNIRANFFIRIFEKYIWLSVIWLIFQGLMSWVYEFIDRRIILNFFWELEIIIGIFYEATSRQESIFRIHQWILIHKRDRSGLFWKREPSPTRANQ